MKSQKKFRALSFIIKKDQKYKQLLTFLIVALLHINAFSQAALTPVASFGTNPGNLRMYSYVPPGVSGPVSLVVVLHGCTQTAASYAAATGWNKLADKHKFILLYPEQKKENNVALCFNWFDSLYQKKDMLQVLSIKQMVDYMKSNYTIDTTNIFITGLSAGGAMSNIMLANYPETFKKGAVMSGIPFKASLDTLGSYYSTHGYVTKTPEQWGALVKNANPSYTGAFPDVALFHGGLDSTVYLSTNTESVKQWTNVNGADQTPDSVDNAFQGDPGISLSIYNDSLNKPVVYFYNIKNMKHAVSIDTGTCTRQGGEVQAYAKDFNLHSTYWAADFFGILQAPYNIAGSAVVLQNAMNIVYSVPNTAGSTYNWSVPQGASVASGQGSSMITVNFGINSGNVSVEEIQSDGCINDKASKFVKVLFFNVAINKTSLINCHGDASGELTAIVTGNTGPYTYNWLPIHASTSTVSNLEAGHYTLIVKDGSGRVISVSNTSIVEPPPIITRQFQRICEGESLTVGTNTYSETGRYTDVLTSSQGCDSTVNTVLVVSKCPENNTAAVSAITIYPNPITSLATIQFASEQNNVILKVIDRNGNEILVTNFSGDQFQLNAENWKKGNYTVLIIDGDEVITENIMVK